MYKNSRGRIKIKIAFITDGNRDMGMGHIYRSLNLANELKKKSSIIFLTKSSSGVLELIKNSRFSPILLKNDQEILDHLEKVKPDIIIIDRLNLEEEFIHDLKQIDSKIVVFGNLSSANKHADIVINAVVGSNFSNSSFLDEETETLFFYGPRYLFLRKEFYDYMIHNNVRNNPLNKIVLIFGACDNSNLTSKVLNELYNFNVHFDIDIIVSPCFSYIDEVKDIIKNYNGKKHAELFINPNVAYLMSNADLVITSPGNSMFEALSLEKPIISIKQSDLHQKAFLNFPNTIDATEIYKINEMISTNEIYANRDFFNDLQIGKGKNEVIKAIMEV